MAHLTRRTFLKRLTATGTAGLLAPITLATARTRSSGPARPTRAQLAWQDAEVGVIFHFDLPVAAGMVAPNNAVKERLDPAKYHPSQLNTDQWLEAARAAGAGYAVFTATHFNGFLQWQSDLYPYGVKQSPWRNGRGDVVADFINSCHKYEIEPGLYLSTHRNAYWTVWGHYVNWGSGWGTLRQAEFNRVAEQMTAELCSRYGPLLEIWYDAGVKTPGEGGPNVLPIVEKYQPDIVFYHNKQRADHRWIGNEDGHAGQPCWATMPYAPDELSHNSALWRPHLLHGVPGGGAWSPGMVDVPLRGADGVHSWFWQPDQAYGLHPVKDLVRMYNQSVGRNCNLVIGAVINPQGIVPAPDVQRLRAFGEAIRHRFRRPVAETDGSGPLVTLRLPRREGIHQAALQEDISLGERVRQYALEGLTGSDTWKILGSGECIGHKAILRFDPVNVIAVRLRISEYAAEPRIRRLAIFGTE